MSMKKIFEGLMKAILILGFGLIIAGFVLKLIYYPLWYYGTVSGFAFKVFGGAIYFLAVRDKK